MQPTAEQWLPIPGWDGYEVSDHGRVRSVARVVMRRNGSPIPVRGTLKQLYPTPPTGYLAVHLKQDGRARTRRVHVLVLEAFVGPRPAPEIDACHNNGDHLDNRLSNLRWDTKKANAQDSIKHGRNFQAGKTHCKRGHDLNVHSYVNKASGGRQCRICLDEAKARYRARKRAGEVA